MGRRIRLLVFVALAVSLRAASADDRPNIVFIFSDDHATRATSCYDRSLVDTPNIDRIAREGIRFDRCFVTNSLCSPSRAVILTGKHSHLNGKTTNSKNQAFDGTQATFPKLLQQVGYETALFGKWHLISEPTGFDKWTVLPGQGYYYRPEFRTPDGMVTCEGYVTDVITDMSLDWLESRRGSDKPFLLMCQHKAPHREVLPAIRHLELFDGQTLPEPPTLFEAIDRRGKAWQQIGTRLDKMIRPSGGLRIPPKMAGEEKLFTAKKYQQQRDRFTPTELAAWDQAYAKRIEDFATRRPRGKELVRWKYQEVMKDYLRTIVAIDENVGRLLDYLDQAGLADNTVVIYASDQGFFLGEHGLFNKRLMYEESLRMPLVVRWPEGIAPGQVSEQLVQNLDFAPTFLELAGATVPGDMQGESLVPIIRGEATGPLRDAVYYHYYGTQGTFPCPAHCGVRTDRYKLIDYYRLGEKELYDLNTDPTEMTNLIDSPKHATVRTQLEVKLAELQQEYQDDTVDSSK